MPEDRQQIAEPQRDPPRPVPRPDIRICQDQIHKGFKSARAGRQAAIHIGFSEFEVGLRHQAAHRCAVMDGDLRHRAAADRAKPNLSAARGGYCQLSGPDELSHDSQNESLKHGAHISVYSRVKLA